MLPVHLIQLEYISAPQSHHLQMIFADTGYDVLQDFNNLFFSYDVALLKVLLLNYYYCYYLNT